MIPDIGRDALIANKQKLFLVGLTGGIGSGKSTVGRLIQEQGLSVLDADQIAREIVRPGTPAHAEIVARWPTVLAEDGTINRKLLAAIVFSEPTARAELEGITHPRIRKHSRAMAAALASQGHSLAFYEASLLVETGRQDEYDGLVVVTLPESVQLERATARGNENPEQIKARIAAQLPLSEKIKVATDTIDNSGDLENTRTQIKALLVRLRARFGLPAV